MKKNISKKTCALAAAMALIAGLLPVTACAATADSDNTFTFSDTSISVSGDGDGYEIDGTELKITEAGVYTLKGSCEDGSVTVKKGTTGVTLILKGLTLTATDTAPISCSKNTEVTIQVSGKNTLTDAEDPDDEDSTDEAVADAFEGAAIKVKSGASLTLTGSGTLSVDASDCKNGIKGGEEASLTVDGPTLNIEAANTALACDGTLAIASGTLTIDAENEGIKADPDEDDTASAGTIVITGGTLDIDAADDAIHSAGDLTITGGTFTINAGDDAIHSDAVLTIGTQDASGGPAITVESCTEGFEGAAVNLYSGSGSVVSSDDGINAANSDLTDYNFAICITGGKWLVEAGGDGLDSNGSITVSGGTLEVYGAEDSAGGDTALDAESTISVTGGTVLAVDTNGITPAGTSVRFGSGMGGMMGGQAPNGMGGRPGENAQDGQQGDPGENAQDGQQGDRGTPPDQKPSQSEQAAQTATSSQTSSAVSVSAGDKIVIKDSSGSTVYSTTAAQSGSTVLLAGDAVTAGESYTLYLNGTQAATATAETASSSTGGMMGGQNGQKPDGTPPEGENGAMPSAPQDGGFTDVAPSAWYFDAVRYVQQAGLMNGTSSTTFAPDTTINRAMLVTILYRLAGSPEVTDSTAFTDVKTGQYYSDAVAWASENGIVIGYGDGTFGPNDGVTREQLATILYRYTGGTADSDTALAEFSDGDQVSDYAAEAMNWCVSAGLLNGTSSGKLSPQATATRAQAATILMRYLQNTEQ